ncbi:hydroxymethylglutaryl-CoA reductase, degradative [Lactobacillus sp. LL6]|uniref:hydroxymethylglutaryl-CoA reductase, degradative n=1 Tax=Lactobacillus sp. LL6 TaxID=2596827 RepID=UPI00118543A8|nr:hydroxymethylglutaryl-CoA reductase, degradative [Lactobacillus sp. LL6]TSO25972.1 hydroxymethylglutaryl-CoA reductase, degradative [Lactobacillus sp. LL6]
MKFYQLSPKQRRSILEQEGIELAEIDSDILNKLDQLSENVVSGMYLPVGVVQNLIVNNKRYLVPMVTEEPSVVAAANHAAKIFAQNDGAVSISQREGIYGQIVMKITPDFNLEELKKQIPSLKKDVNIEFSSLIKHGGGLQSIEMVKKDAKQFSENGELLFVKVLVDPAAAMGANKVNSILEFLKDKLLTFSGIQEKLFAILSNYPSQLTTAKVELDPKTVGGLEVAKRMCLLSAIAEEDVYRAVTNNKGIMNGVDSVLIATGQDFRAIEAAVGVFASRSGKYRSLSEWKMKNGKLVGELTLPMAIGVVGGSIKARNDVQQAFNILGQDITVAELANIITTIGLANNLSAILAISTVGIQAGHMRLQARNLVADLDANQKEKNKIVQELVKNKNYTKDFALQILNELRGNN